MNLGSNGSIGKNGLLSNASNKSALLKSQEKETIEPTNTRFNNKSSNQASP
jgi:hypothetical protein